ncbi:rhamnogalacturonan acetylesterase [Streptomyces sp. NBC_01754]|uniref:rhamnogalacturonan acetylesterase n=1 Tax=Streptomyces sp. NBC_01754 TaxID=2975930 RepID=UPI002DD89AF8|nr:rhamnogalacturonan acetylesterase [Streptomyces sp. NBC_01754]WSC95639.1 rhamnogalacturonan acetylesterase [Streptomyces sp. NBC_01754]
MTSRQRSFAPMAGWGQALPLFIPSAEVINCARAGASSRSFMERGRMAWILREAQPGDLVLLSFGLIDMKPDEGRHTEPFKEYQRRLRGCVDGVRGRGAHPVLVTSHERRVFDAQGNLRRLLGVYPLAMREVAVEKSVPLIDLNEWSVRRWREAGPEGTRRIFLYLAPGEHPNYPEGVADNTHLKVDGAIECARFIARELRDRSMLEPGCFADLERLDHSEDGVEWLEEDVFDELVRTRTLETVE